MIKRLLGSAALAALLILCGCERLEALAYRPSSTKVVELLRSEAPAWSSLITDFNADGIEEFVLAGHRGNARPGFCLLDGSVPCQWQTFLDRGKDRHDCTAGDIDTDGLIDLYCTSGADRGAGLGLNEVWRQDKPMTFEKVPDALGASEESARGRLAVFFDFNRDVQPDLITTTWGTRSDGKKNRSALWINAGGVLRPLDAKLPDSFGARCLSTSDVDGDGFVDLVGCPAETGLTLLRNHGGSALEIIAVGDASDWYWDTQLLKPSPNTATTIISSVGSRKKMFIEIAELTLSLMVKQRRRISCWQGAIDEDRDVYCGRLTLHDADGDGHTDILVSRRKGFRHEDVYADAPDLVIFGPSFQDFTKLPMAAFGASERLLVAGNGIVQVNAGQTWPGSINLVQFVSHAVTNSP